ncbi:MAG: sulfatase [Candidatus Hydrogenedentes bacterium]|nr:sulfatase [Candidatus Hydrogenedentota bacterium]
MRKQSFNAPQVVFLFLALLCRIAGGANVISPVTLAAVLPSAAESRVSEPSPKAAKPNVIIFLSDTLRADFLSCYGYPYPTSPNIDAFARRAVLFEKCYAQSAWTKPSVASMLTGYVPSVHQAIRGCTGLGPEDQPRVPVLREQFVTLGEKFRDAGYQTAVFQMNSNLLKEHGFAQGFEHYQFMFWADPAAQMDETLLWLESQAREPFLLYVHLRDPHWKYVPPPEMLAAVFGKAPAPSEQDQKILEFYQTRHIEYDAWIGDHEPKHELSLWDLSPQGLEALRRQYAGEVRYIDDQFSRLMEKVAELNVADHTIIAVVSDHGEAFKDHGNFGHGLSLYDELLHVPLIIGPLGLKTGRRVAHNVRMFDLYPSLLTLCAIDPPAGIQAESLFAPNGSVSVRKDRLVFSETDRRQPLFENWLACVIDGRYKLIHDLKNHTQQFFDLKQDPRENDRSVKTNQAEKVNLLRSLRLYSEENAALAAKFGPQECMVLDQETREQLRAIGYVQ